MLLSHWLLLFYVMIFVRGVYVPLRNRLFFKTGVLEETDWWQTLNGDWRRTTKNGDAIDGLLDRYAENYIDGVWPTVEAFEYAIDRSLTNLFGDENELMQARENLA